MLIVQKCAAAGEILFRFKQVSPRNKRIWLAQNTWHFPRWTLVELPLLV